ncbi:MAG: phage tail protein [Clostridiales bacterium]|nr:MAG: phage tail protein [Clostridiales bacterium]
MYEQMTFERIVRRMLDAVPQNVDKREGSILYDAVCGAALELANLYIELDVVLNETFADTASREYLIRRAAERGLSPEPATNAVLRGEFNIDVPIGSRFSLEELNYAVIEKISTGVYRLRCETPGEAGNKRLGDLIPIDYIEGLQSAKLTGLLLPGEDEEDTEVFRKRYLDSLTSIAFGGNQADYKQKVSALDGVGGVRVMPAFYGAGTVQLIIKDSDMGVPSAELVSAVKQAVDPLEKTGQGVGIAPIGHKVTVDATEWTTVNVAATITYESGWNWAAVKTSAEQAIDEYFMELRTRWPDDGPIVVRVSQIEMRLLNLAGVLDVTGTTLNGNSNNLLLAVDQLPKRGTVSG